MNYSRKIIFLLLFFLPAAVLSDTFLYKKSENASEAATEIAKMYNTYLFLPLSEVKNSVEYHNTHKIHDFIMALFTLKSNTKSDAIPQLKTQSEKQDLAFMCVLRKQMDVYRDRLKECYKLEENSEEANTCLDRKVGYFLDDIKVTTKLFSKYYYGIKKVSVIAILESSSHELDCSDYEL